VGTPLAERVVQVHLTTRCNLRCAHCYSTSGPDRGGELDLGTVLRALETVRGEGYSQLSLSGGEPTLYRHLPELLAEAKRMSWRTSVITNGLTVASRRFQQAAPWTDVVAVSLDGGEVNHDRLRGHPGSFRKALASLAELRSMVPVTAAATCVTRQNLRDLPDLHAALSACGVDVWQLRPLTKVGRATRLDTNSTFLSHEQTIRLAALASYLDSAKGPRVRCEHVPRERIPAAVEAFSLLGPRREPVPFSTLVNPLVIDERGDVFPFAYGLPRAYSLGNIATLRVGDLHRSSTVRLLPGLVRATATLATQAACPPFVDWYSLLLAAGSDHDERVEARAVDAIPISLARA
jgi:MoaA/NifB/PqqE/SkfB family radical SAM enzyme